MLFLEFLLGFCYYLLRLCNGGHCLLTPKLFQISVDRRLHVFSCLLYFVPFNLEPSLLLGCRPIRCLFVVVQLIFRLICEMMFIHLVVHLKVLLLNWLLCYLSLHVIKSWGQDLLTWTVVVRAASRGRMWWLLVLLIELVKSLLSVSLYLLTSVSNSVSILHIDFLVLNSHVHLLVPLGWLTSVSILLTVLLPQCLFLVEGLWVVSAKAWSVVVPGWCLLVVIVVLANHVRLWLLLARAIDATFIEQLVDDLVLGILIWTLRWKRRWCPLFIDLYRPALPTCESSSRNWIFCSLNQ